MGYCHALAGTIQWARGEAYRLVGGLGGRYGLHGLYPGYAHRTVWVGVQGSSAFLDEFTPVPISPLLRQELEENVPLARDISTEKARSDSLLRPS